MAPTTMNLCSLFSFLIILSAIPVSFSQPQNIQTFYPFPLPPLKPPRIPTRPIQPPSSSPSPPPLPPPLLPPPPPAPPLPPPSPSSKKKAVGTAIGVTAAGALVLSAIFFFILVRSRRERSAAAGTTNPYADPYPDYAARRPADEFARFGGKVKGVIVDEEGLDVLYWRKLEGGEDANKGSFKRQIFGNVNNGGKEEEKRVITRSISRKSSPIQEIPLLRGKSSTSQDPAWSTTPASSAGIVLEKQDSLPQRESRSPPPPLPPPPPSFPPAPPPPSLPVQAISKASSAPPAPPPPPPPVPLAEKKSLSPPLPPNPGGLAALSKSQEKPPAPPPPKGMPSEQGTSGSGKEQVKLKPLHWDKVNANADHSMVWNKIEGGSFKFDGDLMEALFGYVAVNRKSPKGDTRSPDQKANMAAAAGPAPKIFILETRKSQNIAIVLKSLGVPRGEIIDALNEGKGLNAETLEKLCRIAPSREEELEILNFEGDPTRLADAESFLFSILKSIPSAFTRFDAMLFRSNYAPEILQLNESLRIVELACDELRGQRLFMKLLEAILKAGNRMNAGTSRGDAQAFNLTALRKLSDVKSVDGKTTLLHFVVQEVVRAEGRRCVQNRNLSLSRNNSSQITSSEYEREKEYITLGLPIVGGLSSEFSNVKKAAAIDYDAVSKTCPTLSSQASEIRKLVAECGAAGGGGFATEMRNFLDNAEGEIKAARERQIRAMELVKRTTDYYQAGASSNKTWKPLQLFAIIRDFLEAVDRVCVEVARNLQKKKPEGTGDGSSPLTTESPSRAVRFPKLPANFLSEQSKSNRTDF